MKIPGWFGGAAVVIAVVGLQWLWDQKSKTEFAKVTRERDALVNEVSGLKEIGLRALNCETRLLSACSDVLEQTNARHCWAPIATHACEAHFAQFEK